MVPCIDVRIPYEPKRKLATAYYQCVYYSRSKWVLLLDHDLFLCNPYWYLICLKAVNEIEHDEKAALVTCVTNGTHRANRTPQKAEIIDKTTNINNHINVARNLYRRYGDKVVEIDWPHITGFFMLVKRDVAREIGFRRGESGKIDWNFSLDLLAKGYHIYLIPGLYVYHNRGMTKHIDMWKGLGIANYEPKGG